MPTFRYTGEDERFFPTETFGRYLQPGDTIDAETNPDPGRFADVDAEPFGTPVDPVTEPDTVEEVPATTPVAE